MSFPLLLCLLLALPCQAGTPLVRAITVEGARRTHSETIRRELLVAIGEPCDSALVAESERNLRRLPFLGQVHIATRPAASGIELVVEVEDLYSRALSPLLAGQLDQLSYGLVALDYNLGGRGQIAQFALQHHAVGGDEATLDFEEPHLRGGPLALGVSSGWSTEGHLLAADLTHPFRSLADDWSYGASLYDETLTERRWQAGSLSARYREGSRGGALWFIRSFGSTTKIRPGFRLSLSRQDYHPDGGFAYAPADRTQLTSSLNLTLWQPRYRQERFLQQLGRTEDLQTGSWISLRAGLAWRARGGPSHAPVLIQLSPRLSPGNHTYLWGTFLVSAHVRAGAYRELGLLAELLGYHRLAQGHWLALRLKAEALSHSDDRGQYLLGADTGLRGLLPRTRAGQRRLVANAEVRPTFWRRPVWVLAGALFADAGAAWSGSRPDMELAPGAGLRLGMPRLYNSPVLRADLARPLRGGAWVGSLGLGQYF